MVRAFDTTTSSVEKIAEKLRREPYHFLTNDCIIKSLRFRRMCRALGIKAKAVIGIGLARASWFGKYLTIPVIHAWGEVEGKRIETSRPLGHPGIWGIIPMNIRPVLSVRI